MRDLGSALINIRASLVGLSEGRQTPLLSNLLRTPSGRLQSMSNKSSVSHEGHHSPSPPTRLLETDAITSLLSKQLLALAVAAAHWWRWIRHGPALWCPEAALLKKNTSLPNTTASCHTLAWTAMSHYPVLTEILFRHYFFIFYLHAFFLKTSYMNLGRTFQSVGVIVS